MKRAKNKLIYGVGINDANYEVAVIIGGKRNVCPFYRKWSAMIERCYSEQSLTAKPTYIGCSVVEDWLTFSSFKTWMIKQEWQGMQLDKDILKEGNKVYGPDTCAFVDRRTNILLTEKRAQVGLYPAGVTRRKNSNRYISASHSGSKNPMYIGSFGTPEAARKAYLNVKSKIVIKVALTQPDRRVFLALLGRSVAMRNEMKSMQERG